MPTDDSARSDPSVREISSGETACAYEAMRELRTGLTSASGFAERVDGVQRLEGYRLAGAFEDGREDAVTVAGFHLGHHLAWGRFLYVDDLVTRADRRSSGHGQRLLEWLIDEAKRLECDQLHLDSGVQRHDAHRFYRRHGLVATSHHFAMPIERA